MNKRRFYIAMAVVVVMIATALAGCSPASTSAPAADSGKVKTIAEAQLEELAARDVDHAGIDASQWVVGISNEGVDHPSLVIMRDGIKEGLEAYGIKVLTTDGGGEVRNQVSGIEDMVANGANFIIIQAAEAEPMKPTLNMLDEKGIPYMFAFKPILGTNAISIVAVDNAVIGRQIGEAAVEDLTAKNGSPKGNVVIIEGIIGDETSELLCNNFRDVIKDYPEIKVIASVPAEYRRPQGFAVANDILSANPDPGSIDLIYGANDDMAMGAVQAVEEAGRDGEGILIYGVDACVEMWEMVRDGRATATWQFHTCVLESIDVAIAYMKGEPVPPEIVVYSAKVTQANHDTVLPAF